MHQFRKHRGGLVRRLPFVAMLCAGVATAQDFERIAPKPVTPPGKSALEGPRVAPRDTTVRLKELKGIVFLADPQSVKSAGAGEVSGLDVSRVPELQNDAFRARMSQYLGKPVSFASVEDMVRDVVVYFTENDRPFVVVTSPEQDITGGVLQLVVV